MSMTLGAEPKKLAALGILLALLVAVWAFDIGQDPVPGPSTGSAASSAGAKPAPTAPATQQRLATRQEYVKQKRQGSRQALRGTGDFKPTLKPDKDNPIDPMQADPTLLFERIKRVQSMPIQAYGRSLFEFSGEPSTVAAVPKTGPIIKPKNTVEYAKYGPEKPAPPPPPAAEPPPPPIPLKFYGFVNSPRQGGKRAFFMEGEDIHVAGEGELLKGRYKVIRIGVNSVVVEDTQHKNNRQTLPLTEESQSS